MTHQWDASELPVSWGAKYVSLFFCAGDFRKSPLPSFERSIICIIWHFFHIEMKLFSEANPFPSLRFTLICGCWQEINSHFSCTFCWKSLLQRIWTFFWSATAQFGDHCPRIDVFTKACKWYSCMALTQAWLRPCMWEGILRWRLE